jgi:hypothetical protein
VRTVALKQPPLPWGDGDIIIRSSPKGGIFERGQARAPDLLLEAPYEHGNIPKISREDEGVDGGAHAEDQRDVGES